MRTVGARLGIALTCLVTLLTLNACASFQAHHHRPDAGLRSMTPSPSPSPTPTRRTFDHPLVVAHRGGAERFAENSMAAFDRAIADKVDILETDVRHTADGVAVLIHDPTLPKPCAPFTATAVNLLTWQQMSTVRCSGQPIARLAELVERMMAPDAAKVALMPEIKDTDPLGVRDSVRPLGWHRVFIQSYDLSALSTIEAASPEVTTCALIWNATEIPGALAITDDCILADWHAINADSVAQAHAGGALIMAYTVDDAAQMSALIANKVDGIITNRPTTMFHVLATPPSGSPSPSGGPTQPGGPPASAGSARPAGSSGHASGSAGAAGAAAKVAAPVRVRETTLLTGRSVIRSIIPRSSSRSDGRMVTPSRTWTKAALTRSTGVPDSAAQANR
jgi:glycerophosphoryl diester phosphodiesterase